MKKRTLVTLHDAVLWAENELRTADVYFGHGTDTALDEAAWLLCGALHIPPTELESHLGGKLDEAGRTRLEALVHERIATRKPTAYLLKEAWFAGLSFYVDERVIIPRSLTAEFIEERFAPWIESNRVRRLLDLCTGSGCMAIVCAIAFPQAQVDAVDVSDNALAVARVNVERHDVATRMRLIRSDLFDRLTGERYDVIVTNPPYVGAAELEMLPPEYRFEPRLALEAEENGLEIVRRILTRAADHLEPEGILVCEVGNSREALEQLMPHVPFVWLTTTTGDESVFMLTAAELARYNNSKR